MLLKTLTYEEAVQAHPVEAAEVLKKLRKSRSKHKNTDPATLTWAYEMAVTIQCDSLLDILAGKKRYDADFTLDEQVADYVSRCHVVLGVLNYSATVPTPAFVGEQRRVHLEALAADQAAFEALPRAEQLVQQEELLSAAIRGGAVGVIIRR